MKFISPHKFKRSQQGFVIVMLVPLLLMISCLLFLVMDVGPIVASGDKTQTLADGIILSELNVRADALQEFAQQQASIGSMVVKTAPTSVLVPRGQWLTLAQLTSKEKSALSGYKGRLTSALTVFMNANGR